MKNFTWLDFTWARLE